MIGIMGGEITRRVSSLGGNGSPRSFIYDSARSVSGAITSVRAGG
jgi:hypothetical protein